ncbi:prepilin peptidase [Bradyrhizobium sp. 83002]|uniref:prepilin peptidase n=1 Tax=Bradyrhizobium aeschynomenes TaxID=2734909 RepID=UPI0015568D33|nr:A24 family peptidase [Bradyrhizobium aeschynomenes]NPU14535.1 prepilin peptidase [Bradyrhizobium aeschynomenes]
MTAPDIASTCLFLLPCILLLLTWSDFERKIIPNSLNAAVAVLGAVRTAALDGFLALTETVLQALLVAAVVWLFRRLYVLVRNQQGLGLGDVKLLAASTLWVGLAGIPIELLCASLTALAAVAALHMIGYTMTRKSALPFGPFLAFGLLASIAVQENGWLA